MRATETQRLRRKQRIRKKIEGTPARPRLTVFRSSKHIYAQVVDDEQGKTLASASSQSKELRSSLGEADKTGAAKAVGQLIAKLCTEKGLSKVVFDRNGYIYHGRIRALADGAREAGLQF